MKTMYLNVIWEIRHHKYVFCAESLEKCFKEISAAIACILIRKYAFLAGVIYSACIKIVMKYVSLLTDEIAVRQKYFKIGKQ